MLCTMAMQISSDMAKLPSMTHAQTEEGRSVARYASFAGKRSTVGDWMSKLAAKASLAERLEMPFMSCESRITDVSSDGEVSSCFVIASSRNTAWISSGEL